ncbi:hypothetical protein ACTWQF_35185 [Streptomyces sp. 8N114]|uniref:hypothetical protein n=1 Tax=Streptomyces sp. 8N114 TaxID=3457419 RepID=UPI003FD6237C
MIPMDMAELVLKYVEAVIWPLVTLTVAWYLRAYLREAFARMTRIETPAGAIEFEAEARQLRERAEEMGSTAPYGWTQQPWPAPPPQQQPVPPPTAPEPTPFPGQAQQPGPAQQPVPPPATTRPPAPAPAPEAEPGPAFELEPDFDSEPGQPWSTVEREPGTETQPNPPAPKPLAPAPGPFAAAAVFGEAWEIVDSSPVGALATAWATLTERLHAALPPLADPRPGKEAPVLRRRLLLIGAPPDTVTVFDGLRRLRETAVRDRTPVTAGAARNYITGCERLIEKIAVTH